MWYEILPSAGIMYGLLTAPPVFGYFWHKYVQYNGKTAPRDWDTDTRNMILYLRDIRLTGSEYKPQGLEAIPDES